MTDVQTLMTVPLLTCLLLTGAWCQKDGVFVYSRVGGDALLPCTKLVSPVCSNISMTFYREGQYSQEVSGGRVNEDSHRFGRMSIMSNCSISLRDLRVDDAGSYLCLKDGKGITDIYLSVLDITSFSTVTDLQPGGNLTLNCILFTYYDAGSCTLYSSVFSLSWAAEDGTELPRDSRYKLVDRTRCNISLITTLQRDDNNRRWRCQVNTKENSGVAFLDFTSTFLLKGPPAAQNLDPSVTAADCPVELPISRIVLCAALPVMVVIVGLFTWRGDQKRARRSAAGIELQEVNC